MGVFAGYFGRGQCGFTAVLGTSKYHCVGSSLLVKTTHAMQKIVWYKDGAAVLTTTGTSSLDKNYRVAAGGNGQGTNDNQMVPNSVFVDEGGNIFVSDQNAERVQKWAPGAPAGVTVAGGNGMGADADQLSRPRGFFVDKSGDVYIADADNHRIQKWAPGASAGVTVAGGNGQGPGADQLDRPNGIYLDCNGTMYIADGGNSRIQKWIPGASAGVTVVGGNPISPTVSYTAGAGWVGFDGAGNMYVGAAADGNISKWAPPDFGSAILLGSGDSYGATNVTKGGDVYVAPFPGDSVLELADGTSNWQTVGYGFYVPASNYTSSEFEGLCLDIRGNLYISDGEFCRVLEFKRTVNIDSSYTPTAAGRYMAMVIDINGDTAWTGPEIVNVPFSGPAPSVQISASATTVDLCEPVNFTATAVNPGVAPVYQWQVSGVDVGGDSLAYSNDLFANGDRVVCILTTDTGCSATPYSDTSNIITLTVNSQSYATVAIAASDTAVCAGTPITFTATVTHPISPESYQWSVNGVPIADNTPAWVDSNAVGGQVVYCVITSNSACGLSKSNSVPVTIYPLPTIAGGQVFSVPYGKSLQLDPTVTGDIYSYAWSPATGLSDAAIRDPVADPLSTTLYTLAVTSLGGCKATGEVTVDVYTPLSLPNAFTPNGDGHNDVLYVLGGPEGSQVKDFAVFSRWGQPVFAVHDAPPGDPRYGWNGYSHGSPAPADTYVYIIVMQYANGSRQRYKGTVVLVR